MGYKRQNNGVQPGPCPIIDGVPVCPPPTQIDVITVTRVFDECMNTQVEETEIVIEIEPTPDLTAQCVGVTLVGEPTCSVLNGNVVRVNAELEVTTSVNGTTGTGTIDIERSFIMYRAGEEDLTTNCFVYPECLTCYISATDETSVTVTCCVGVMVLLRLQAEVQLMIPSYGYPPEPAECEEALGQCPAQYNPTWPPYPSQNGNNNNQGCCGD